MMRAERMNEAQQALERPDGGTAWIPAKPEAEPLLWRLRDAWRVVTGEARAVVWPKR